MPNYDKSGTPTSGFPQGKQICENFITKTFCDKSLLDTFEKLTALYFEVNSVINISAIRNVDDLYIKHYLDSIYPYEHFSGECCDVGCGGGFPCIPLALVTKLRFTGIDSVGKKLTLINRFSESCDITNIDAIHARAEDVAKAGRAFDTVCSRAVSNVEQSLKYCAPLAKPGGKIVLYRTQNDVQASKSVADKLSVRLDRAIDYNIPDTDIKRRLFIYVKSR